MDAIETIEYRGGKIEIFVDEDAVTPYKDWDCEPEIALHRQAERRFGWTTDKDWSELLCDALDTLAERGTVKKLYGPGGALEIVMRWARAFHGVKAILPISAYDHSGVSVWLGSGTAPGDSAGWDSGWIGWLILTDKRAAEWGVADKSDAEIEEELEQAFAPFAAWVEGEVYGYAITSPDGDEIEAVWGFYGMDSIKSELGEDFEHAKAQIDEAITESTEEEIAAEDAEQKVRKWISDPALLAYRPCLWQTHTGTVAPKWDVDPGGETDWSGYCGRPTNHPSHLCAEHLEEIRKEDDR